MLSGIRRTRQHTPRQMQPLLLAGIQDQVLSDPTLADTVAGGYLGRV